MTSLLDQRDSATDDTEDEKPRRREKVDAPCNWTGKPVSGVSFAIDEFIRCGIKKADIIGFVCPSCGKISHHSCEESGISFNWWSGYGKSCCAACGESMPKPKVVVSEDKIKDS